MSDELRPSEVAANVRLSVVRLARRMQQVPAGDDLSLPEITALARIDRGGPATSAELARQEQISPQSMGATLSRLEAGGLVGRRADPVDGRRVIMSLTPAGTVALRNRRTARVETITAAIEASLTSTELKRLAAALPLLDRITSYI